MTNTTKIGPGCYEYKGKDGTWTIIKIIPVTEHYGYYQKPWWNVFLDNDTALDPFDTKKEAIEYLKIYG